MDFCVLPLRPTGSLVDDSTAAAAHRLAEALVASAEYQAFVQAARAVRLDRQVSQLLQDIRLCRASYDCGEQGALQSELENLAVMVEYERASRALRTLLVEINQAVGAAAGLEFIANVRPDRHG